MRKKLLLCKQSYAKSSSSKTVANVWTLRTSLCFPFIEWRGKCFGKNIPSNCIGFLQEEDDTTVRADFYLIYLVLSLLKPAIGASSHVWASRDIGWPAAKKGIIIHLTVLKTGNLYPCNQYRAVSYWRIGALTADSGHRSCSVPNILSTNCLLC